MTAPAYFPTKYDSPHSEAIVRLAELWADASDYEGTTEAPCGSWMPYELDESGAVALLADLREHRWLAHWQTETETLDFIESYPDVIPKLPGLYVIQYDDLGFVTVSRFDTEDERAALLGNLDADYAEWLGDDDNA